jgi:hypothetical protein
MRRTTIYLGTFLCMLLFGCLAAWALNKAIEHNHWGLSVLVTGLIMLMGTLSADILRTARDYLKNKQD